LWPGTIKRARSVGSLLRAPDPLNVRGEWSAHSHYLPSVRARFNQTLFGTAYGASVLLHLIHGVNAEVLWTGTDDRCGYGVIGPDATPTPLYFARRLCAQRIQYGDAIVIPTLDSAGAGLDGRVVRDYTGRPSAVFVQRTDWRHLRCRITRGELGRNCVVIKIDAGPATPSPPVLATQASPFPDTEFQSSLTPESAVISGPRPNGSSRALIAY
jgi:hypothetical protein